MARIIKFYCVQSCPNFGVTLNISLTSISNEFPTLNWTKLPFIEVVLCNINVFFAKFPNQKL